MSYFVSMDHSLKQLIRSRIFTLALISTSSLANFTVMMKLYQSGEYGDADAQSRTMAKICYYPDKFNLGVMYATA